MRAYKAAILSALSQRQIFTLAQLGTLNKLFSVFHRRRPLKPSPTPTWDIGLVLRAFTLAPFEPLATASLKAVTYKTINCTRLRRTQGRYAKASSSVRRRTGLSCCYTQIHHLFPKRPREDSLLSRTTWGTPAWMTSRSCAQ